MAFIKHKLGKTFYFTKGRAKDNELPIICLHGGPGGHHFYFMPLEKLSSRRKIIFFDQIGSGRSSKISQKNQNVKTIVEDLHRLIKKLKIERFHLLGTSWGGSLALEYYFRYRGEGVASLLLQSPLVKTKDWVRDANRLLKTLSAKDQKVIKMCLEIGATDSKVYKEAEKAFYKKYVFRGEPSAKRKAYAKKYPNPHGEALYEYMWGKSEFTASGNLKNFDRAKDLGKIKVPTIFICGQHDEARPETLRSYAKKIPGCQVDVIRGASHSVLSERPKEILKSVSRFVEDVEAGMV